MSSQKTGFYPAHVEKPVHGSVRLFFCFHSLPNSPNLW